MKISKIELLTDQQKIQDLYEFIKDMSLDYPNYKQWAKKCYHELLLEYKKAFVCTIDNKIIGNLVFQQHKQEKSILEIKNGRVNNDQRNKKIFTRLYRSVERYALKNGYKRIIADTHSDNKEVIETFRKLGFIVESQENLYNSRLEVILVKDIK